MKKLILASAIIGLFSTGTAFAACEGNAAKPTGVLEVVNFELAEGVSDDSFIEAAENVETSFLCSASGYVRRTLTKRGDGTWMDVVEWETLDDALSAMKAIESVQSAGPFMQAISFESIKLAHWTKADKSN